MERAPLMHGIFEIGAYHTTGYLVIEYITRRIFQSLALPRFPFLHFSPLQTFFLYPS